MTSSRVQNYPDHHAQTFPPVSFSASVPGMTSGYWAENRAHAVLADPYPQYGHHGVTSAYDTYKNAALIRGTPLAVGSAYGGNFMEIASNVNGSQYPRHDGLAYQEDLYTPTMPPSLPALHKHYLATSFR
nr:hypothetical protein BaRGS_020712 [Batillaria attramentaria]